MRKVFEEGKRKGGGIFGWLERPLSVKKKEFWDPRLFANIGSSTRNGTN